MSGTMLHHAFMKDFLDLVNQRVSCRGYKPDPVPGEMIDKVIEAARLAPSACNRQPWRFAVIIEEELRRKIADKGTLPGLGMAWISGAPVILVLGMKKSLITHQIAPAITGVDYSMLDIGIAGQHAILQATELGLGTCWIGWINQENIRKLVKWPSDIIPQALITIGWPATSTQQKSKRLDKKETVKWM